MNIPFKKILCLLVFCNLFMGVAGVSAFDNSGHQHNEVVLNTHNEGSNDTVVINQEIEQNNGIVNNSSTTNNVGTFTELNEKIQEAIQNNQEIVELDKDYQYDKNTDNDLKKGISINNDITLEGNGHSINGSGEASAFKIGYNSVVIKDIFIVHSNENDGNGGAIYCDGTKLSIVNCQFENNKANTCGGAIYSKNGCLNIFNSQFNQNSANGAKVAQCEGGAIYCKDGLLNVVNSSFVGNYAYDFGGAIFTSSDITLSDCVFDNNSVSDNDGGAIYCEGSIKSNNDNFTGNSAYEDGGAIFCRNNVYMNNSTLNSNFAKGAQFSNCEGGAIFCQDGVLDINNSNFSWNEAYDYGGALWSNKDITLRNCYFNDNSIDETSGNGGGAIYMDDDYTLRSYNCTFTYNWAGYYGSGGAIYCDSRSAHVYLEDNNFIENECGSNKGSVVFNYGYFEKIHSNWWGTVNPNWDSGLLWEDTWYGHEIRHDDSPRMQPVG